MDLVAVHQLSLMKFNVRLQFMEIPPFFQYSTASFFFVAEIKDFVAENIKLNLEIGIAESTGAAMI
jgi:hypothetical protein